jgi:hypothetical protein
MAKRNPVKNWEKLQDEEILQIRVRDLRLQIPGSPLEPLVNKHYEELNAKNISFCPPCYLADEWLCPDKVPIIGIPFYLAHPRLKNIEQRMMFEVEGGTEQSFMKLLRHECGHAMNYAYQLYRRTRWRELFGPFSTRYSDTYNFQPYSKRYVMHLQDNYAQSHPDEDFAETFAVWLTPENNWRHKYNGWPVFKKLQYVDNLMKKIGSQPPLTTAREHHPWSATRMTSTLAAYYERKRRTLGTSFQGYYDDSLKRLFAANNDGTSRNKASNLLRHHRRELIDYVTMLTGHRKFDMHQLVKRLIARCDALDLYPKTNETQSLIGLTALLTAIASNTLRVKTKRKHR